MDRVKIASELVKIAKELMAIDFHTQEAMDKYLKEHPEADKVNHKVVKEDMMNHPFNQMRVRQHEKAMGDIARHYKKDPKDLTNDEIVKYNQRRSSVAYELTKIAKELVVLAKINDQHNMYWVVVNGQIESGWGYQEDAKEHLNDLPSGMTGRAYTRIGLKAFNLNPDSDDDWIKGAIVKNHNQYSSGK